MRLCLFIKGCEVISECYLSNAEDLVAKEIEKLLDQHGIHLLGAKRKQWPLLVLGH